MSGHRRRMGRRRNGNAEFCVFSPDTPLGPKFLRRVSKAVGDAKVAARVWRKYENPETHECLGYQMLHGEAETAAVVKPSLGSFSTTFTRAEMDLLNGGQSKTETMRERWKRDGFVLSPDRMDAVEAARFKRKIYRTTH